MKIIRTAKTVTASKRIQDWVKHQEEIQADSVMGQDNGFFTRDDCIDFIEVPLEERIRAEESYGFQNSDPINLRAYIDEDNNLEVDCDVDDCFFTLKAKIDMRKIKKPSDIKKYVTDLFWQFDKEYCNCIGDVKGCSVTASEEATFNPTPVTLKSLKKGTWFTLKPIEYPTDKQVYIKDDYDREEKKFMCGRCDDISYSTYFKGDKLVYTDFIY